MLSRVLAAVAFAAVLIGVLVVGTRAITAAVFEFAPSGQPSAAYLVINVLASMIAAGIGGYVCVRRAPDGARAVTAGLLFIVFLAAGLVTGRAAATPMQPLWFQALAILLGASGLLCGVAVGASRIAHEST